MLCGTTLYIHLHNVSSPQKQERQTEQNKLASLKIKPGFRTDYTRDVMSLGRVSNKDEWTTGVQSATFIVPSYQHSPLGKGFG